MSRRTASPLDSARGRPLTVLTAPAPRLRSGQAPQDPMASALSSFLARCSARGLAETSIEFYRFRLDGFLRYLAEHAPEIGPAQVTASLVRDFLQAERERRSPATAKKARTCLCVFFEHLVREGLVAHNPVAKVERVKVPQKLVRPLTEEEVGRLLEAGNPRTFLGARLRALVLTLVDCGLRASEACGLDLEDADLNAGLLRVRQAKGGKEREVPFGEATRQALLAYLTRRGDLPGQAALFVTHTGDRLDRFDVAKSLRTAGEKAGVANVHAHRLRHSAATFFLRGGGNIFVLQRMLGHSSLTMVRRYAEVTQSDLVAQHRQASPGDRFLSAAKAGGGRRRLR